MYIFTRGRSRTQTSIKDVVNNREVAEMKLVFSSFQALSRFVTRMIERLTQESTKTPEFALERAVSGFSVSVFRSKLYFSNEPLL